MKVSRRAVLGNFCATALGTKLGASSSRLAAGETDASSGRAYKIIYNWDGAPHDYSEYPQSLEQFLAKVYAPMKDTQVGAHFWCIGEHEAKWPSKTMDMVGDSQNRLYDSVRAMRHIEGVRAMFERGEDPYKALVKRGHELGIDVFASVRMNDNHFSGLQLQDMPTADIEGLTRMRKEHPEWCLGADRAPKWFAASWNFAIPEVREHRLEHIGEVCRLAEWDGIELDWQRHAFHLPADDGYRLRYTLTDLQRAVRQTTSRVGRERNKPLRLAVRVATTMEACRLIGYDLRTWVNERLCDMVIAGGGAGTDPGIEVEAFKELLRGTGIQFYPGFDGGLWGDHQGLMPETDWDHAFVRATAKGYWERGADGMYVFNWHSNERKRRPLLTTIGSVEALKRKDKVYPSLYRFIQEKGDWVGADIHDRLWGETPVALYRTITDEGPTFHVPVYDDVAAEARAGALESVALHIELEHYCAVDRVEVKLDGKELPVPTIHNASKEVLDGPSDVDENSWLVWALRPEQVDRGTHMVRVRLMMRSPRVKVPIVVRSVEMHVRYKT